MKAKARTLLIPATISTLLFLPCMAGAAVRINEIMYDLEGTDTDREWIEVVNDGSAPIDIENFKLFENGSNHGLTLVSGSSVLAAGGVAVIAANATAFLAEHAGFSGTLFDSAFSLSNTGETLGIRNGAGIDEDSAAYASTMGAQGDGKALGRSGSTFMPQTPSPGSSGASPPGSPDDDAGSSNASASMSASNVESAPHITVRAAGNRSLVVGASSVLSAQVYGLTGEPIDDARITWNLGNGETREGRSVQFLYRYPGRYAASVTGVSGAYAATERFTVEAATAEVRLRAETDGSLTLLHTAGHELDLSLWQIERAGTYFRLPQGTVVLAGEGIRLSPETTKMPPTGIARVLYPNGDEVAEAVPALERVQVLSSAPARAPIGVEGLSERIAGPIAQVEESAPSTDAAPRAVYTLAAAATAVPSGRPWAWALGAFAVSLIGAAGVVLLRTGYPGREVPSSPSADAEAEKYTIV